MPAAKQKQNINISESATAWFCTMEMALKKHNQELADQAMQELARLGVFIRFRNPLQVGNCPPDSARGSEYDNAVRNLTRFDNDRFSNLNMFLAASVLTHAGHMLHHPANSALLCEVAKAMLDNTAASIALRATGDKSGAALKCVVDDQCMVEVCRDWSGLDGFPWAGDDRAMSLLIAEMRQHIDDMRRRPESHSTSFDPQRLRLRLAAAAEEALATRDPSAIDANQKAGVM